MGAGVAVHGWKDAILSLHGADGSEKLTRSSLCLTSWVRFEARESSPPSVVTSCGVAASSSPVKRAACEASRRARSSPHQPTGTRTHACATDDLAPQPHMRVQCYVAYIRAQPIHAADAAGAMSSADDLSSSQSLQLVDWPLLEAARHWVERDFTWERLCTRRRNHSPPPIDSALPPIECRVLVVLMQSTVRSTTHPRVRE